MGRHSLGPTGSSVAIANHKLQRPGAVCGCSADDSTEVGRGYVNHREPELDLIEGIEGLDADPQALTPPWHLENLGECQIYIVDAISEK